MTFLIIFQNLPLAKKMSQEEKLLENTNNDENGKFEEEEGHFEEEDFGVNENGKFEEEEGHFEEEDFGANEGDQSGTKDDDYTYADEKNGSNSIELEFSDDGEGGYQEVGVEELLKRRQEEQKLIDEQKMKEENEEFKQAMIERLTVRFNPTTAAAHQLLDDYRIYLNTRHSGLAFIAEPVKNNLFDWKVNIVKFPPKSQLAKDMKLYKQNHESKDKENSYDSIELQALFPPDYPNHPPFIRVIRPRFMPQTGRITSGGSICTTSLTDDGWTPYNSFTGLMLSIVGDIFDGEPRIDVHSDYPYSLQDAREAYVRVAKSHGWKPSSWIP